jgi:protein-disulfide isomerase
LKPAAVILDFILSALILSGCGASKHSDTAQSGQTANTEVVDTDSIPDTAASAGDKSSDTADVMRQSSASNVKSGAEASEMLTGVTEAGHHWIGAESPKVIVEVFTDYECPYCRLSHEKARAALLEMKDDVRLIHRHMPLDMNCNPAIERPFHQRACEFSIAVECAGEQGRFWPMNDALFEVQNTQKPQDVDVTALARSLSLDLARFNACLRSEAVVQKIAVDIDDARSREVRGTPTYFIGDNKFAGRFPTEYIGNLLAEKE